MYNYTIQQALLNPRQIAHLKKLQPNFHFKTRKVNIPKEDIEEEDEEEGDINGPGAALFDDNDDEGDADGPSNCCK